MKSAKKEKKEGASDVDSEDSAKSPAVKTDKESIDSKKDREDLSPDRDEEYESDIEDSEESETEQ